LPSSGASRDTRRTLPRGVGSGKQIKRVVATETRGLNLVAELCQLLPVSLRPKQVMREIATVAVRDRRQNVFSIVRRLKVNLGNAGKIFAD
jgi:hypothetical protein